MSGKIPAGKIATDVVLNMDQPKKSLTELRREVTQMTQAWKAEQTELKATGNSIQAAEAKYKGLSKAMDSQQSLINKLKADQAKLDTTTKNGAEAYNKLGKQLVSATTKFNSLQSQQEKAKTSMDYYKSGLAALQKEYRSSTESSRIYADRLKAENNQFEASKVKMTQYRSSLSNLTKQLKVQQEELKRVASESGRTSDAYRRQENRLNKTGLSLAELKSKQKDVRSEFNKFHPTGIAHVDKAIDKLKLDTGKLASSAKSAMSSLKTASIGLAAGVAGAGAFALKGAKEAGTLQKTLTENNNLLITSGEKASLATKEVTQMQKDGRKYSVQYAESQKNISAGYQELIKRGYDGKQSLGAMKAILQASKASGDSFADTMQVTTSTLEAFGMRTKSTAGMLKNTRIVANKLAMAADATATDFKSLGIGMNYVGTSAKTAGLSLTETASAMGVLSNSGLEAQQAGTGLRKILISLQTPSKSGANALEKYGLSVDDFKTKSGKLKPIAEIFKKIADSVPKADRSNFFHNVFGTTGQNAAAILATNTKELERVNKQVAGAYKNDYVGKLANKNMKATKNQEKQFHEAIEAVQIDIGTAMMPALSKASQTMVKVFNRKSTMEGLDKIAKGIGHIANKAADFVAWLGKGDNLGTIVKYGKAMLLAFASYKIIKGIAAVKRTLSDLFGNTLIGKYNQDKYNASLLLTNKLLRENAAAQQVANNSGTGGSAVSVGKDILENTGKKDAEKYVAGVSKNVLNSKGKIKFRALFQNGTKIAEEAGSGAGLGWARKLVGKVGDARVLGQAKWMKIFHPASKAAEKIGATSGKGLIGKLLPITAKGFTKVASGAAVAFDAIDIFKGLTSGKAKQQQRAKGQSIGLTIGGAFGAIIGSIVPGYGTVAGATLGASLGKATVDFGPRIWANIRHGSDGLVKWWKKSFLPSLGSAWNSFWDGLKTNISNFNKGLGDARKGANSKSWFAQWGASLKATVSGDDATLKKAQKGMQRGQSNFWSGINSWWNGDYNADKKKKKSKKSKLSPTDEKVMASAMDVSKKSIGNVKAMSKALKSYAANLGRVKSTIKKNDPSKELNAVSKSLSKHEKTWAKLGKDIKPIGDAFKYLATFAKSMAKVDAFKALTKDLPKLEKSLNSNKKGIIKGLKDLNKAFGGKSDGIYSKVKSVSKVFDDLDTKVYHLNKKLDDTTKDFKEIGKVSKQFSNKKNNPFDNMATGLDRLKKALKSDTKNITKYFKDLTKSFNDTTFKGKKQKGLISNFKAINKPLGNVDKSIVSLSKHIKPVTKGFQSISKVASKGALSKIEKSIKKLSKTLKKNKFGEQIAKQVNKANGAFKKKGKKNFVTELNKDFSSLEKSLKTFKKRYDKDWSDLWDKAPKDVEKAMKDVRDKQSDGFKKLTSGLSSSSKKYNSHFNSWLKGLSKSFKKVFESSLPGYAKTGMNKMIATINKATAGVNKVIGSFGGNSNVISKIHLATGTGFFGSQRKAITKPTLAVLNDGQDSPETGNREAIYRPSTGQVGLVNGVNVPALLGPGDEVFNATETKMLGLTHFANGTGYLKQLYEQAKAYNKKPTGTLDKIFNFTDNAKGGMKSLVEGSLKKTGKQAVNWWGQLWQMVDDKIDDDNATGLLKAVEKYGEGRKYVWGSHGPDAFDCSGLIEYALKKSFGISLPAPSGNQYAATQHISKSAAKKGDLVFWGVGGGEHVGVYAGGNRYFSAESPAQGIHMNTLDSVVGKGAPMFGRIKGMPQDDAGKVKGDSALTKKIKVQVGSGFWKTIGKIADRYGVSANPAGDGVGRWKADIIKALKENGLSTSSSMVSRIMRQMTTESHGDPKAVQPGKDPDGDGSGPALGLMQTKRGTFEANAFPGHKNIFNGYDNLLAALHYAKATYGPSLGWLGNGKGYANGGFANKPSIFAEAGLEAAIPLIPAKSTRAWELVGKTVAILSAQSGLGGNLNSQEYQQQQKEDQDFKQQVLMLLERLVMSNETPLDVKVDIDGRTAWQGLKRYAKNDLHGSVNAQRRGLSGA